MNDILANTKETLDKCIEKLRALNEYYLRNPGDQRNPNSVYRELMYELETFDDYWKNQYASVLKQGEKMAKEFQRQVLLHLGEATKKSTCFGYEHIGLVVVIGSTLCIEDCEKIIREVNPEHADVLVIKNK